jgi:DNA-binding SARP family transcriptional activator
MFLGGHPGAGVEFGVLGPVQVRVAGEVIGAGHPRQRAVLAVLLLDLGHVVPAQLLIDRVWGEDPPASVRNLLYGYVARLRAALASAAGPDVTLARDHGGYVLRARPEQVDLWRFRRLVAEADRSSGDDGHGAALLRQALELWRGPALAGTESPWLNAMGRTLEAERFAAELDLNELRLRRGEHRMLAPELASQAAARPADERLTGQLMLALWRSGRPAEALRCFEQARSYLEHELGADPGPQLRALHQQVLRGGAGLALAGQDSRLAACVPRELPADVPVFTGRVAELGQLDQLLLPAGDGQGSARRSSRRSRARPGWARPRSRCTGRTAPSRCSRTASCMRTCAATTWPSRLPRPRCWPDSCGRSAWPVRTSRRARTSVRPGSAACWPGSGCWSCRTTPVRPSRSGRCCPVRLRASPWSPAAIRWLAWSPGPGPPAWRSASSRWPML